MNYNAGQTGGIKSLQNLKDKYNNEKKLAKARLTANKKETFKTGGGTAKITDDEENFGFSHKQINGLPNKFDCDAEEVYLIQEETEDFDYGATEDTNLIETDKTTLKRPISPSFPTPAKYSNKKMRMSEAKEALMKSKLEASELDSKYKQLLIEKSELEKKKLQLEIQKLEKEMNL